jgi:hypothetical protein
MSARRIAAVLAGAAMLALTLAPQAMAATIRYTVAPSPLYAIDNATGIVKVTYSGCVTAGARQVINITMTTQVNKSGTAELKVLKETGQDPSVTMTPNPVNLAAGPEQNTPITLAYTLAGADTKATTFRFKLDPANGLGLGEGPGIMVRIPCVLAASTRAGLANQAPPAAPGVAAVPATPVPTRGAFPATGSSLAAPRAACIALPQSLRVRARRTTRLRITVQTNGQNIRNALVRITLPGGKRIFRRTGSDGVARVFVRPSRSGTLVIQSDVCFGAARVTVRRAPARRSASARLTG